jgi:enamine deaminase RidA (YjgF/YER057c/UK114 family)
MPSKYVYTAIVDTPVPATSERSVTGSRARSICAARSSKRERIAGSLGRTMMVHSIAMLCLDLTERRREHMTIELLNPPGLPQPEVYRQMSIAQGSKLVFLAGQVARDADGRPVGAGDLAAQVEQAYLNVGTALAEIGGSFDDVAKLTIYVVDWSPDKMPLLGEGVNRAATKLGVNPVKPITLLGIAALAEPDLMVEVEATAVLD